MTKDLDHEMLRSTMFDVPDHIFDIVDLISAVHYANVHEQFSILLVLEVHDCYSGVSKLEFNTSKSIDGQCPLSLPRCKACEPKTLLS